MGRGLAIETRYPIRGNDEFPGLVAELVGLNVDLIVTDSIPAVRAAMRETRTIPIVALDRDPVTAGVVPSLSRPGGNVTVVAALTAELPAGSPPSWPAPLSAIPVKSRAGRGRRAGGRRPG